MDRESTQSYSDRSWLLSGLPVYVDSGYSGSTPSGAFTTPYKLIQQAIDGGLSDKVVVLQEGTHTRPTSTIDVPTVMVPRMGPAIVQDSPPDYELPYALDLSDNLAVRNAAIKAQRRAMEDDIAGVIAALQEAEESATGREKLTIQLELAQRYMEIKQFDKSESYYQKVYDNTEQVGLRKKAVRMIQILREKKQAAGKKHKDKE